MVNVDQNAAYPKAVETLKQEKMLPKAAELRQNKYLNNIVEKAHRNTKRAVKPIMRFTSFNSVRRMLKEIEAMNMMSKGEGSGISQGSSVSQAKFTEETFGVIA